MSPFHHIFQRILHDILVDRLANSKSFQRFSVSIYDFISSQKHKFHLYADTSANVTKESMKYNDNSGSKRINQFYGHWMNFKTNNAAIFVGNVFKHVKAIYDKEFQVVKRK